MAYHPSSRRQPRPRAPRYEDFESDTEEDDYDPRRPPRNQPSSHQQPPPLPPFNANPQRGPPLPPFDPQVPAPPSSFHSHGGPPPPPPPPPEMPHGQPILGDEPSRGPRRRRPSNVRLRSSSDEDSDGAYNRRGAGRSGRPPVSRKDLERKNSAGHAQFRERRDGYLSDEGEALRKAQKGRSARRDDSDSDGGRDPRRKGKGGFLGLGHLSSRGKQRTNSEEPPPPYPSAPYGPRRPDYDADPDKRLERRRTHKEPQRRRDDYDDYDEPPRRRRTELYPPEPERGYKSDHGGRRRGDDYYGRPEYDRDPYDRRKRDDGYRSDGGPRRRDYDDPYEDRYRRGDGRRRDRYEDDRGYRDYDHRDPYRERGSSRYDKRRSGGRGSANWQKEAADLFMTYGLPIITKQGLPFVKEQLAKRRGGGL